MQQDRPSPTPTRPDPDPTVLTTLQLYREVGNLEKTLVARISAIEQAIAVSHEDFVRVPTQVDKAVDSLRLLTWERFETVLEKFKRIETQFLERDTRVEQTAKASKEALDAALQAAKEAVGEQNKSNSVSIAKSEAATNKQIDQLSATMLQNTKASDDKIGDLKERLTRIEGQGAGERDMVGYIIGAVGLVATLVSIFYYLGHTAS